MRDESINASILGVFLQEADEGLTAMEQALVALEANPSAPEHINEIFRIAHTIKGGAAMVDFPAVAEFAHRVEDALMLFRDGLVKLTPERITLLLQITDALRAMVNAHAAGQPIKVRAADTQLVARLLPVELQTETTEDERSEHETAFTPERADANAAKVRSLRVDKTKLDFMLTLSGEIAVAKGRLMQTLSGAGEAAMSAAEHMNRLLTTLHERVTEMRLVPVGPLFRQHVRTVRDLGATQSKLLRLNLEGEDVEVDATIIEQLRDPLTHIVRNAIDHGIEMPASRRDAGKDPCGTITLHARHERGTVIVEIRDDGQGMNKARLLAKGRERGLVSDGDVLTDAQIFALATAPGLSTADRVTELSGRGVGMDVVRKNIESMRGSVEIVSTEGQGTTIRLRLPLTVAIIDGFAVAVRDERYVIPVGAVTECLTASETERDALTGVLSLRGTALPYVRLRQLLGTGAADAHAPARESIVIVQCDDRQVGLVVDELIGETQAVIKPLAGLFNDARGISGTTIMGDGRVSLILDVAPLVELAHRSARAA